MPECKTSQEKAASIFEKIVPQQANIRNTSLRAVNDRWSEGKELQTAKTYISFSDKRISSLHSVNKMSGTKWAPEVVQFEFESKF